MNFICAQFHSIPHNSAQLNSDWKPFLHSEQIQVVMELLEEYRIGNLDKDDVEHHRKQVRDKQHLFYFGGNRIPDSLLEAVDAI